MDDYHQLDETSNPKHPSSYQSLLVQDSSHNVCRQSRSLLINCIEPSKQVASTELPIKVGFKDDVVPKNYKNWKKKARSYKSYGYISKLSSPKWSNVKI